MIGKQIDPVNELRYISATAISKAGSGHTGICMGAAPIFYALYRNILKITPENPSYFNRDRFVLDAGHAVPLLYSTLNLFGFNFSIEDLKNLRKLDSKTKGHISSTIPNLGIDASGGPLGQGLPMAVGMAIAEKKLATRFNKINYPIFDHYTYCFISDGGIMEGITNEASSLAGTLELSKLIVLYDSNNITIEGGTDLTLTENVLARYSALGWNTMEVEDGEDVSAITKAIRFAKMQNKKPTLIKINTHIGVGTIYQDSAKIHGKALNSEELLKTKELLKINLPEFAFSDGVKKDAQNTIQQLNKIYYDEKNLLKQYSEKFSTDYDEMIKWLNDDYSKNFDFDKLILNKGSEATRISSKNIIGQLAKKIPNLLSGSADVSPSTGVEIIGGGDCSASNILGRNFHFGLREHAMSAICNGIMLHGGFRVICSTFMVFSDYMRHAIRMSALMKLPVVYICTHDSIGVGEDGSTHQPIEYNALYRATPNLNFIRPADAKEVVFAYKTAFSSQFPTVLALTRQKVEYLNETSSKMAEKGGYLLKTCEKTDVVLMSAGSETQLIVQAEKELKIKGINCQLVSIPCMNIYDAQTDNYKQKVMPNEIRKRVAIEAGNGDVWYKYVGLDGVVIDIKTFGKTGESNQLFDEFNINVKTIIKIVNRLLKK